MTDEAKKLLEMKLRQAIKQVRSEIERRVKPRRAKPDYFVKHGRRSAWEKFK